MHAASLCLHGMQAPELLAEFKRCIDVLLIAIREPYRALIEMGDCASPAADVTRLKQQLDAAAEELQTKLEEGPASIEEAAQELAPQLRRLAELATQAWVLTGRAAESQLARARLAAARSCAYLGCANVASEGGPRQQEVQLLPRGVVCGEACQLADWREGGHRRVCGKPLRPGTGSSFWLVCWCLDPTLALRSVTRH
jgi:hypothetical protein